MYLRIKKIKTKVNKCMPFVECFSLKMILKICLKKIKKIAVISKLQLKKLQNGLDKKILAAKEWTMWFNERGKLSFNRQHTL